MNKGILFAISNRRIKSYAVESQLTLLVWPYSRLPEKQCTINRMITFNDSVSKFYHSCIWGFWRGISMFFSICLSKKNAKAIKFLGIFKNVSKNKIYLCLKKKSNVLFDKKVICLSHDFETWFYNADHLMYSQMSVFSFYAFFFLLYQFRRKGT